MKRFEITVAAALAGVAVSTAAANGTDWAIIADSEADFSSVQGAGGWSYLSSTSRDASPTLMTLFDPDCWPVSEQTEPFWTPVCGSYCFLGRDGAHTNSPSNCSGWQAGFQIPIRRYTVTHAGLHRLTIDFHHEEIACENCEGVDGVTAVLEIAGKETWSAASTTTEEVSVTETQLLHLEPGTTIDLLSLPNGGCHADLHRFRLRVSRPDCNLDGIADFEQILDGTYPDENDNGVPDCCDEGVACDCPADITGDGRVDAADIGVLLAVWNTDGGAIPAADINGDGTVNASDLGLVLGAWGLCS